MDMANFPRVELAALPTALQPAPRLSRALGGKVNIWIKRDDNTGLAIGGNKARKLEFLLADALRQGCDTVLTTGGPQSNHCRMTAAAAAKLGLECHLVFNSRPFDIRQGNLLLDELLGAKLHWRDPAKIENISREMSNLAEELKAQGRRPYIIPLGGSNEVGAMGYVYAVQEILQQAEALGIQFEAIVHASGSGGTQAGLLAGKLLNNVPTGIIGVSVSRSQAVLQSQVAQLCQAVLSLLDCDIDPTDHVEVTDAYVGAGYGLPTEASQSALQLFARNEGIIIYPVYTAKAAAALVYEVQAGRWPAGSNVVFWHTGGSPALFADSIFWEGNRK